MSDHGEPAAIPPATLAWVRRHLDAGERIVGTESLPGGITADLRRLTVAGRDGRTRALVLRSFVDAYFVARAEDSLTREAAALSLLATTTVPAPELVALDPTAASCAYPSLLMTHLPGRTVLNDDGVPARLRLLAGQLVAIHAIRPAEPPREYEALTTAETVVIPEGADAAVWSAAIDVIRRPAPRGAGRFLHRDFQPGNVLFDGPAGTRIAGVLDWAGAAWGPPDLDVAHCAAVLALLHGPAWGLRFPEEYERAGGRLAADANDRRYWLVRDALALSEEVAQVARPWRDAGRTELTARTVAARLDAYLTALMGAPS
ncbi:phosphotransferase family protein [Actinocatenispora sera]|uniref:Aminoglycoside phosphotransferase domain-containing protein n=1 Tax=Actinocatenispora sera TaxID=390989 RepID=A0A810L998_9ACTN|nr:phosphotransferase [Actinocatenispora sera]BCJ31829.1 hypothetical protein Asera_59370 [Actinocatenispora sera]